MVLLAAFPVVFTVSENFDLYLETRGSQFSHSKTSHAHLPRSPRLRRRGFRYQIIDTLFRRQRHGCFVSTAFCCLDNYHVMPSYARAALLARHAQLHLICGMMEARRRRRAKQETTRKATVEELARPVVAEPIVTSFGNWAIILGAFLYELT